MKSNVRCWTPPAALLIAMLLLSGCGTGGSETHASCPPVVEYSFANQVRAAAEVEALPATAILLRMLSD